MACGFLIVTALFSRVALTISGKSLSFAQSPPPITLPARTVASNILFSSVGIPLEKKDFL